jgi:hypothetical protein
MKQSLGSLLVLFVCLMLQSCTPTETPTTTDKQNVRNGGEVVSGSPSAPTINCSGDLRIESAARSCLVTNGKGFEFVTNTYCNGVLTNTQITQSCRASACNVGYELFSGSCKAAQYCVPGSTVTQSCSVGVSTSGRRTLTCLSSGLGYQSSVCVALSCPNGYALDNGNCVYVGTSSTTQAPTTSTLSCSPGSVKTESCASEIPNATMATVKSTCNSSGQYVKDSCIATLCASGYLLENNACVKTGCTPGSRVIESCKQNIANSEVAQVALICNSFGTYEKGSCVVSQCISGYMLQNNTCVKMDCSPGAVKTDSCIADIPNSTVATVKSTCNSSGQYVKGSCTATLCATGYLLQNNSCVKMSCTPGTKVTESCKQNIANAEVAEVILTCNSNGIYEKGSCVLKQCSSGFYASGNNCLQNVCSPNQTTQQTCTSSIANSTDARITRVCNSSGSGYTSVSPCNLISCQSGYTVSGNTCAANPPPPPANPLQVFVDLGLFDPDLGTDARWVLFDFDEEFNLGRQSAEETDPVTFRLKLVNTGTSSVSVSYTGNSSNFQVVVPPTIAPNMYDFVQISMKAVNPGTKNETITFTFGSRTIKVRVAGEIY